MRRASARALECAGTTFALPKLLIKGRSNKEIGSALFVTEDTVKAHRMNLFTKLNVRDLTEAAISAIQHGLVHLS